MPLDHSPTKAAFKSNVRTLMHDVGTSPHVKNQSQALAIAYALKRRGRAEGGAAEGDPLLPPPRNPMAPPQAIADALRKGMTGAAQWAATPGMIAQGVQPQTPGQWSEEDEFRKQSLANAPYEWGPQTALTMAGMGTPFAARGTAGIFGGKLAATADQAALARAEKMASKGSSPDKIWDKTGWFQGADGKWRFEIPDFKAKVTDAPLAYGKGSTAGEKLEHPELYAAYPDVAQTSVINYVGNPLAGGEYSHGFGPHGAIGLTDQTIADPKQMRSTMLHELQHAIQRREGFEPGAALNDSSESARTAYRNNAGEVEARNVETRAAPAFPRVSGAPRPQVSGTFSGHYFDGTEKQAEMIKEARRNGATPQQIGEMISGIRAKIPPWKTEDVPLEKQTIRIPGRAMGGQSPVPWFVRNEARSMTHSGPIMSAVPGRTDRHNMKVAANSYVLPADFVSHLGQNNSQAGHSVLNQMFGSGSPYGGRSMPIKHGPGAPRPPQLPRRADGGAADVEVVTAGGEYILPPSIVESIGGGDAKMGHQVLDRWVMNMRKNHVKTLKGLPPPAKS
jgi:hypothetical protein